MEKKNPLLALDSACLYLKCGVDLISTIHTAMTEGSNDAQDYADALYGAHEYLNRISSEIADYTAEAIRESRGQKAEVSA